MPEETKPAVTFTDRQKMEAAYALNLCTVSLSQIIDYHDLYVLEQEYDAILNNLNVQNIIHDESLLAVIKKILETITFFRIKEGDKKFLEQEYQGRIKSAIWSAVPSLSVILSGGNPLMAAVTIATSIGTGYMAYRKAKKEAQFEKERKEWEMEKEVIEEFTYLRRELFEAAWRLSDKYNFDDRLRLTEKQIAHYDAILMDADLLRRYERLDTNRHVFEAFPPFWYYKGNTAKEIAEKYAGKPEIVKAYREKALADYRKFDEIYVELMREDVIAASCALEHIALLDKDADKEEIKRLLHRTMSLAGDNFDVLQLCILNCISVGESALAKDVLRRLVNEDYNVSLNGLLLSRIYCKWDKNKAEYDILSDRIGARNVIPWIDDDLTADKTYIEGGRQVVIASFKRFLSKIRDKHAGLFAEALDCDRNADIQDQARWCLNTDVTQVLVNQLNAFFTELLNIEVFSLQKEVDWNSFFRIQAVQIAPKIQEFYALQTKALAGLQAAPGDPNRVRTTVKVLLERSNFNVNFANGFLKNLLGEFQKNLSVKSISLQDNIRIILDRWYIANGLPIPENDALGDESEDSAVGIGESAFFEYP
jgi:hypothetical protein